MRTVEEQLQLILAPASALEPLDIPLQDARGCVLAADIKAGDPIPAADIAAVDGYAARALDLKDASRLSPVKLGIADELPPGYQSKTKVTPGQAVRVATGAAMPAGADVVVALDQVKAVPGGEDRPAIEVPERLIAGRGVRRAGSDVAAGNLVIEQGAVLGELELAAVVSAGRARISVYPKPRVVIITTGDDLEPLSDVNGTALIAAATDCGATAFRGGPAPEDPARLAEIIEDQLVRADLIVITGGIQPIGESVGGPVFDALRALGTMDFTATAVEPGPIIGYGKVGHQNVPVMTVPGDPASAMIAFEVFAQPLIRLLSGRKELFRPVVRAQLTSQVKSPEGVRRFMPAVLQLRGNRVEIEPLSPAHSTSAVHLRNANALAIVPEDAAALSAGDHVAAIRLDRG